MWEYLKSSTPIYHETINNCLQQACVLDNTGKYARCDPYYIFLWWNYSGETTTAISFLKEACTIQHESWFGNNNSISDLDNIFSKIRIAVSRLEQSRENNILPYVYSLNMLLLSLANLRILRYVFNSHFEIYDTVMMQISANSGDLIHAVILCDYYTRKFNYTYNEGKADCRITDLFLLSGAIRFLCSYHLKPDSRVNLGPMMQDYIRWYGAEYGRWKILLTRLLSYTDFFSAANTEIVSEEEYKHANFLEYDHVPKTYTDFRNEIDKRSSK